MEKIKKNTSGEIEIVEFVVSECCYGINVDNVKEIIRLSEELLPVPDTHASVDGVINLRGKIIPVVNTSRHLNENSNYDKEKSRIIITEYGNSILGFWVNQVNQILRMPESEIEEPSEVIQSKRGYAAGIYKKEEEIIILMDFEKIIKDITDST